MKIIENEEESNKNRKGGVLPEDPLNAESRIKKVKKITPESDNSEDSLNAESKLKNVKKVIPESGKSEDPLSDSVAVKVDQNRVPAVTPRGRGRPRKSTLESDAVSPLAKGFATPFRGRGRPRKDTTVIGSSLAKDSPLPSEHRGRGRPKKIVQASDVTKTLEKPDEKQNVDVTDVKDVGVTDLKGKAVSTPRRGRGRPKKNFGNFSASTSFSGDKANSTPRRGRGRPRKNFCGATPLSKGRIGHQNDFRRHGAIQLLAQALTKHGRGRPRKGTGIKDAVQLLQKDPVLSKPRRGRPPKSIKRMFAMKLLAKAMAIGCQDEAPKSISITDVTKVLKAAGTSRQGRGQPKKVVATGPILEKAPAVTPRGRGRPRKNLETPDSALLSGKAVTPRGRGRPRKNLATVDTAVASSKVPEPVAGSSGNVVAMSGVHPVKTPVTHTL